MSRNLLLSVGLLLFSACTQDVATEDDVGTDDDVGVSSQALNEAGDFKIGIRVINYAHFSDPKPTQAGPIAETANWASRVSGREFTEWVAAPGVSNPTGIRMELIKNPNGDGNFRLVDFRIGLQAADGANSIGPVQFTKWASEIRDVNVPQGQVGIAWDNSPVASAAAGPGSDGYPSFFRAVLETRPFTNPRVMFDFFIGAAGYGINEDNFQAGLCNNPLFGCLNLGPNKFAPGMAQGGGWSHTTNAPYDDPRCPNDQACRQIGQSAVLQVTYKD